MLHIKNLTKIYANTVKAVDDITIHVQPGDLYGFIGHNGAGKTTTLKCCAGILNYDEGSIFINAKDLALHPLQCKQLCAYIPDNPDIYESLTGIQYINFISDIYKVSKSERERLINHYAVEFEIDKVLPDIITSYSHGMKQKLIITAALVHSPKLLLLDEPFTGLDPVSSFKLKNIMHDICKQGGAVFFSTHVLDVAEKLCNKLAIIKNGKILASDETAVVIGDKSLENVFLELEANA